ncbi:hypothetical protein WDW86_11770, partial [Bdellovibrionota bacterium FG-2]
GNSCVFTAHSMTFDKFETRDIIGQMGHQIIKSTIVVFFFMGSFVAYAGFKPEFSAEIQKYYPKEAKNCLAAARTPGPDQSASYNVMDRHYAGALEVMEYKGSKTDRKSNHGAIGYFSDSVENNDAFFAKSYGFFAELQKIDEQQDSGPGAIEERARVDVYALAMKHSNNNPYIALKLLGTYGHDNMGNELAGGGCRTKVINGFAPNLDSQLYKPASLNGLSYPASTVKKGVEIGKACSAISGDKAALYKRLCNDGTSEYRADYYHVITSAFLACRNGVAKKMTSSMVSPDFLSQKAFEKMEVHKVKEYKISRFREEIRFASGDSEKLNPNSKESVESKKSETLSPAMAQALKVGFKNIVDEMPEYLPRQEVDALSIEEFVALKAILARYKFEIELRQEQHRMGLAFGAKACKDIDSYAISDPMVCAHCPP